MNLQKNLLVTILTLLSLLSAAQAFDGTVQITPISMDFFGDIIGTQKGDVLTVVDPDQVVCGQFTIHKPNKYGFLHVYGDDPATSNDEGAEISDKLTFLINQKPVIMSDDIIWSGDKKRQRLDIQINNHK
ncbi:secreted protein [Candidatus Magnetomorum sp. HK-1]|nr:secreted protein [Candidatus Magnetomorum sp. HK-1]